MTAFELDPCIILDEEDPISDPVLAFDHFFYDAGSHGDFQLADVSPLLPIDVVFERDITHTGHVKSSHLGASAASVQSSTVDGSNQGTRSISDEDTSITSVLTRVLGEIDTRLNSQKSSKSTRLQDLSLAFAPSGSESQSTQASTSHSPHYSTNGDYRVELRSEWDGGHDALSGTELIPRNLNADCPWSPWNIHSGQGYMVNSTHPILANGPAQNPYMVTETGDTSSTRSLCEEDSSYDQQNSELLDRSSTYSRIKRLRQRGNQTQNQAHTLARLPAGEIYGPDRLDGSISENPHKRPRRKGQLSPETRKKACKVRKIGSCWRCFFMKTPCDENEVCNQCERHFRKWPRPCTRVPLSAKLHVFLPPILFLHHSTDELHTLMKYSIASWSPYPINVKMTCGYGPTLSCNGLHYFLTPNHSLLHKFQYRTSKDTGMCRGELVAVPPLGYSSMDPDQVERIYQESNNYLSEFIKINWIVGFPAYAFGGYTFHIQVLVIVVRYFLSRNIDGAELTQRTALNLAFKLLVLTYTMTHTITLAESTDAAVCSNIPDYDFDPCSKGVSPKLMNRQLKVALKALIERLKESLLQEFEKLIRSKKKSRWGTAFCVIIIFAVVLEDLQTCIHIQADIDKHNPGTVVADDDQVQEACHRMEHEGIDWLIDLFHQSFRTHKKNDGSFDPLSDGFDSRSNPLDLAETILVDGIRTLMDTSSEYIMQKAHCHPGTDIRTFEGLNTSRIVCRFLTSFESDPQEA